MPALKADIEVMESYPDPFKRDDDRRAAAAIVEGANRESTYVPYQDSPYYHERWYTPAYEDDDDYYSGSKRRGRNHYYSRHQSVRRRRYAQPKDQPKGEGDDEDGKDDQEKKKSGKERESDESDSENDDRRGRYRSSPSQRRRQDRDSDDDSDSDGSRDRSRSKRGSNISRHRRRPSSLPGRNEAYRKPELPPQKDPYKPDEKYTIIKAAKSAAMAGGVEALRCRKEEGSWTGQKGQRIAIAAGVGVVIGALRNGRLLEAGKMPYAEAAMTGFYAIDFLKRVARHSEHGKNAEKEQRNWREDAGEKLRKEDAGEREQDESVLSARRKRRY